MDNAWAVLGIPRGSSKERIRARYMELVRENHPDRFRAQPLLYQQKEYVMARINEAYTTLMNQVEAGAGPRSKPNFSGNRRTSSSYAGAGPISFQCLAHNRWAVIFCTVCQEPLCSRCDTSLSGLCSRHRSF